VRKKKSESKTREGQKNIEGRINQIPPLHKGRPRSQKGNYRALYMSLNFGLGTTLVGVTEIPSGCKLKGEGEREQTLLTVE